VTSLFLPVFVRSLASQHGRRRMRKAKITFRKPEFEQNRI